MIWLLLVLAASVVAVIVLAACAVDDPFLDAEIDAELADILTAGDRS